VADIGSFFRLVVCAWPTWSQHNGVEDQHRFDADPDSDPNVHVDADPDPDPDWNQNDADPHADPTSGFKLVGKSEFFYWSQHYRFTIFLISDK
jgi:hypothetical protein